MANANLDELDNPNNIEKRQQILDSFRRKAKVLIDNFNYIIINNYSIDVHNKHDEEMILLWADATLYFSTTTEIE